MPAKPHFFTTAREFRRWLQQHHASADELLVGYYKADSGRPSMRWSESVDEALCYGWIDGIRRRIDEVSYSIRFTPRRANSVWSAVNLKKVEALIANGQMQPAGMAVYRARDPAKSQQYSYERAKAELDPDAEAKLRAHTEAWAFFQSQPPGYRRSAIAWVTVGKRATTRERRLQTLIDDSARGLRIAPLRR